MTASTTVRFRFCGKLSDLDQADRPLLFDRTGLRDPAVGAVVAKIIERVRARGDSALRELANELDGVALDELEVPAQRIESALNRLPPALRSAMSRSAANLERVHAAFVPTATLKSKSSRA